MLFRYISFYAIDDILIESTQDTVEREIYRSNEFKVVITRNVSPYLSRKVTIIPTEQIDEAIDRAFLLKHSLSDNKVLVVLYEIPFSILNNTTVSYPLNKNGEITSGLGNLYKKNFIQDIEDKITPIIASIFLSSTSKFKLRVLENLNYVLNQNGIPVRHCNLRKRYSDSITINENFSNKFNKLLTKFDNNEFKTISQLIKQVVDNNNSNVSKFLFSWSILEIIINKYYAQFNKLFHKTAIENNSSLLEAVSKPIHYI
jgi:hypothetical protein